MPEATPLPVAPEPVAPEPQQSADLPAGLDPDELAAVPATSARRGRLRRRVAFLRAAREVLLRDLGGFVYELHRTAGDVEHEAHKQLRQTKLARLSRVDAELHELELRLDDVRRDVVVREPGVGGECTECGELYGSDARFCAHCGLPLTAAARKAYGEAAVAAAQAAMAAEPAAPAPAEAAAAQAAGKPAAAAPAQPAAAPTGESAPAERASAGGQDTLGFDPVGEDGATATSGAAAWDEPAPTETPADKAGTARMPGTSGANAPAGPEAPPAGPTAAAEVHTGESGDRNTPAGDAARERAAGDPAGPESPGADAARERAADARPARGRAEEANGSADAGSRVRSAERRS